MAVEPPVVIDPDLVDAVLFDLDGVLTDTAALHLAAWQQVFDEFLADYARRSGRRPRTFDPSVDYASHLDGRLRHEGVAAVLASRSIVLATGDPADPPGHDTVWALANRKQGAFMCLLGRQRVALLPGALELVRALRRAGVRTGVVSSSRNADPVLISAGLDRFDIRVDGVEAERLGLPGKPDPASFLEAAARLKAPPSRIVVFEDAIAGVRAAHAGDFGRVVGVGVGEQASALRDAGADIAIADLTDVEVAEPFVCCASNHRGAAEWVLVFDGFDPHDEARREALCTTGNGYMATRGAAPEASADETHYPGTYLAGIYNRLVSHVAGKDVEHEDLVNTPNWLPLTFRIGDGEWFGGPTWELLEQRWELDLRHGILTRRARARDALGRIVAVEQRRLVSMHDVHLAALQTRLTAENWSGRLEIRAALDAQVTNAGVRQYRQLDDRHLGDVEVDTVDHETVALSARTLRSRIRIAQAARTRIVHPTECRLDRSVHQAPAMVAQHFVLDVDPEAPIVVDKIVAVFTSRDPAIAECGLAARTAVARAGDFDQMAADHRGEWERLWTTCALWLDVDGRTPTVVNLHVFHLLQSLSPRSIADIDAGVTARGLHGEAYRGHVFWDELFVFPFVNLRFPAMSRALLMYRHRRLGEARWLARRAGHEGAMFPWQSGSDGREETPTQLYNARSRRWMPDNSRRQHHVGLAIAYNVWDYHQVTGDTAFLRRAGAELLVEIARFWSSVATYDPNRDRYDIAGVMGPDEFHDGPPDRPGSGLVNNTYTNVMAAWVLARALDAIEVLDTAHGGEIWDRLDLRPEELIRWDQISRKLTVEFDREGRLAQFKGYEDLLELDWDHYRATYDNIGRLDLILEAEGDTTNRYKLSKQADVLMLFYLLSAEELTALLDRLGYRFDPSSIPDTVRYYMARTSHGSTLCRVAHAWVLARSDRDHSWRLFLDVLASDIDDTQGGSTGEGIHLGAMAGTIDLLQRCYSGLETRDGTLHLNPRLPDELPRLRFEILYRGHRLELDISHDLLSVRSRPAAAPAVSINVGDELLTLAPGQTLRRELGGR